MIIVGLTGSLGTGKTTVAEIFKSLGAYIIDADKIAHKLLRRSRPEYKKIVSCFGKGVLSKNGLEIDRKKLGKIVFSNRGALNKLNKILHPGVISIIKQRLKKAGRKIAVIDAPLLIEAGLESLVDKVIVVKTNRDTQLNRLISKTGLSKKDLITRINAQVPISTKIKMADFIIDNSGTKLNTKKEVIKIWQGLR